MHWPCQVRGDACPTVTTLAVDVATFPAVQLTGIQTEKNATCTTGIICAVASDLLLFQKTNRSSIAKKA